MFGRCLKVPYRFSRPPQHHVRHLGGTSRGLPAALLLPQFGLTFGIEFQGGTSISVVNSGDVTIAQMRKAFEDAGVANPNVQTTVAQGENGFIIRTEVTNPDEASAQRGRSRSSTSKLLKRSHSKSRR